MTKTQLLDLLKDLPADTVICGFNSEFGEEYDICTAVLVRKGALVERYERSHVTYVGELGTKRERVVRTDVLEARAPDTILVLTEHGEHPECIALEASTIWSKS